MTTMNQIREALTVIDAATRDWHGWRTGTGRAIHVGPLPGRRQVCLYVQDEGALRTLAFFKTTEQAQEALDLLDVLAASRVGENGKAGSDA